ncbi:helix-turn-helix domain-containing protein [Pseudoxanthomonas japonensis]|jgi:transcriptional regulator with XRE-family HTH domain|uniref:helix-turn-helix domain-containing protein n=1 Tax=Pseudoxanthomonas japonensis TaxID=69284 RepID=UPI001BCDE94F|nr:helix-turn-helix transcriptional regulator [Pseudoxanthomonas japonensis]
MTQTDAHAVFILRLKQARKAMGLSQTALGIRMGIPEETASARINRYERGTSEPDLRTAEKIAKALNVSLSWLVCTDSRLAAAIESFSSLDAKTQEAFLLKLQAAAKKTKVKSPKPVAKKAIKKVTKTKR